MPILSQKFQKTNNIDRTNSITSLENSQNFTANKQTLNQPKRNLKSSEKLCDISTVFLPLWVMGSTWRLRCTYTSGCKTITIFKGQMWESTPPGNSRMCTWPIAQETLPRAVVSQQNKLKFISENKIIQSILSGHNW